MGLGKGCSAIGEILLWLFEIIAAPGTNTTITSCLHQKLLVQRTYGQNGQDPEQLGGKKRSPEAQGWVGSTGGGSLDTSQSHHSWGRSLPQASSVLEGAISL